MCEYCSPGQVSGGHPGVRPWQIMHNFERNGSQIDVSIIIEHSDSTCTQVSQGNLKSVSGSYILKVN